MAQTSVTLSCTASAFITQDNPNANAHGSGSYNIYDYLKTKKVLFGFDAFSSSLSKKIIYSAKFAFSAQASQTDLSYNGYMLTDYFNESTVTYNNEPVGMQSAYMRFYPSGTSTERYEKTLTGTDAVALAKSRTVEIQGVFYNPHYGSTVNVYTRNAASANRPVIIITYDDTDEATSKVVSSLPANGKRMDPLQAITFSWSLIADGYESVDPFVQASATFYWSSDSGTTWNSVAVSGSTQSVTIPANTFPGGTIQWQVTATDDRGATTTSETRTIDTTDTLATTTLISPIDTLEANDGEILFRWSSTNASGSTPTGYQFAWRDASVTPASWTQFKILGSTPEYRMPANTLPVGTIIWTVATYNRDDVMGSWSSQAQIRTVGAPAAPVVSVTAVPFATIDWQATGQQAWRVSVDGKLYGPYFGGAKTFTLPDYLADGEHTASVEVQGQYGLWSQAGTADFTVTNVPGDDVTLKAVCYRDADLSWTSDSTTEDWLVYRDGVRIGHTAQQGFTDRRSIGRHSWQVINRLAGGYYTASNVVQGELRSCMPAAVPLAGGEWLELKKSDAQTREDIWQGSQTAAIRHFAGEEYPTAEFAAFKDETVSLSVAWMPEEAEEARRFESLIGQPVIYKNRDRMLIGVLQAFNLRRPQFYRSYSVTLTRIHWRDFVDENP